MKNPNPPRCLNLSEKVKNIAYNFKYKAMAYLQQYPLEEALSPYHIIHLLGKQYTSNPANNAVINKQIASHFKNILWITYRSGFPELLKDYGHSDSFVTDTGWGCMIRVGQMLFAQILKNYLKPQTKDDYGSICKHFNDFKPEALFSIQKIAKIGKMQFNLNPGQWYNPAQIAYILSSFLNENKQPQLTYLKSLVFNNSSFFYDQVASNFKPQKISHCNHQLEQNNICPECFITKYQVSIIILVRLGLYSPEPQYLEILNSMMTWKWFRGILGGKPKKALYFVGIKQTNYIYLDPHYVQRAKQQIPLQHNYDYCCQSLRLCKNTSADPSLGICFYLDSIAALNQLYEKFSNFKAQKGSDFFLFIDRKTPEYLSKQKQISIAKDVQESGQFQII